MSLRNFSAIVFSISALAVAYLLVASTSHFALLVVLLIVFVALAARLFPVRENVQHNDLTMNENLIAHDDANVKSSLIKTHDVPAGALLEATMESMREGVIVVDRQLRVVAANRAASDIFTSPSGTLVGKRLTELTRNSAVHQAFQIALDNNERAEVKVETDSAETRERRAFDVRVAPLRYNANDTTAIAPMTGNVETNNAVGVFFDITRLERLERVRQEFLSNVSHELRTPLTAILTFVETLQAGAIDDAGNNRRFLSVINRNAGRMHNLIDDILELSAIEAGTVRVEAAPVCLHTLVADVLTALQPRADERRIALYNEVAGDVMIYADARRLEQMLTNLVDNAIKFNTDAGSVRVHHQTTSDETRDRISVSDNGEGIAPEHLPRIFERFYRVDRARSRALGGTGLGLAIVKHLARAHGGEAVVTSLSGRGSTFSIELPKIAVSASHADEVEETTARTLPAANVNSTAPRIN